MVFQTEKTLSEIGDKISEGDKKTINAALNDLKEKAKGDNSAAIKQSMEALTKASHTMAEALYKNAGPGAAGAAGGAGQQFHQGPEGPGASADAEQPKKKDKGDGAVDADYEVVN